MANKKTTRRALFSSVISLILCCAMLLGTTFAWFTDSVTSGINQIVAGNLDVELEYLVGDTWTKVTESTNMFEENTLWEPGHTEVIYLKISNLGTLALKYQLGVNIVSETGSINVYDTPFKLSDFIEFGVIEGVETPYADRDAARAAVTESSIISAGYSKNSKLEKQRDAEYVALVVYMPESVDNNANYKTGSDVPEIKLGVNLLATQLTYENDSFDNQYDAGADYPWDGVTLEAPPRVDGVFQVSKPSELAWLAASATPIDHACLTADIDMMGATISSIEIYSYRTFNGNGHTISNVVVDGTGLFGDVVSDCTIKDITLDNITVNTTSGAYAGIVNGKFSGKYENVTVLNSTVNAPNSEYVGGLAGVAYKNIVGCKVENISVTGTEKVGGLIGFFTLADVGYSIRLENCSAKNVTVTATNTAKPYAGVFFGRGLATSSYKFVFVNCSATMQEGQVLIGQDYYSNINTDAITVTTIQ